VVDFVQLLPQTTTTSQVALLFSKRVLFLGFLQRFRRIRTVLLKFQADRIPALTFLIISRFGKDGRPSFIELLIFKEKSTELISYSNDFSR